ncbi:MAG: ABC transporter ATP-binding protein [Porticoccaceae bacterium]
MTIETEADDLRWDTALPALLCRNLSKTYQQGPEVVRVLRGVELAVGQGEKIAIVGASGSGKSTLLNMLGGLDNPTEGQVIVGGRDLAPMSESERARWRNRQLGFVYQFHHLLGEFTALENVAMPLLIGGAAVAVARERATGLLSQVGLDERLHHKPDALSGGERQRVAIARALATHPACVLMDEPTGNLDPGTAETVLQLLLALNQALAISFVIVTHDERVARRMDRVVVLDKGVLREIAA